MMDYHDMGWGDGWWIVMWVMMATFWIVVVGAAVALFVALTRDRHRDETPERPEDTLARRLAAGDIDEMTYRRLRDEITGGHAPPAPG